MESKAEGRPGIPYGAPHDGLIRAARLLTRTLLEGHGRRLLAHATCASALLVVRASPRVHRGCSGL